MIKHGAIRAGETPSEVSGAKSDIVKRGCALRAWELPPDERIENVRVPVETKETTHGQQHDS